MGSTSMIYYNYEDTKKKSFVLSHPHSFVTCVHVNTKQQREREREREQKKEILSLVTSSLVYVDCAHPISSMCIHCQQSWLCALYMFSFCACECVVVCVRGSGLARSLAYVRVHLCTFVCMRVLSCAFVRTGGRACGCDCTRVLRPYALAVFRLWSRVFSSCMSVNK